MKETLGWLAFGLGLAFAAGQYLGMALEAWFPEMPSNGFVSFFGFGLPMVVLGALAAGLWSRRRDLRIYLGWTSVVIALVWGISLLFLVASRAGLLPPLTKPHLAEEWYALFFGFLISMLVCGTSGVMLLAEPTPVNGSSSPRDSSMDDVMREVKARRVHLQ